MPGWIGSPDSFMAKKPGHKGFEIDGTEILNYTLPSQSNDDIYVADREIATRYSLSMVWLGGSISPKSPGC